VGKSSVINVLMGTNCCKAAPVPGETKVWQYIALTKRISLIDCPGVVYHNSDDDEVETVLKGVVRAERLLTPVDYIPTILSRVKPEYIRKQYGLPDWSPNPGDFNVHNDEQSGNGNKNTSDDKLVVVLAEEAGQDGDVVPSHVTFLTKLAVKMGKLGKRSEPDLKRVAVMVINDWQRVSTTILFC
jgi:nuclear GTP-binding protein